jgi:hypothetical protein
MTNYANEFKKHSTAAPQVGSRVMTVIRVLPDNTLVLESNGSTINSTGYYRVGDKVNVMNGQIFGIAEEPVGEHLV